jgi:cytochrome c-type biogenesis protein CcmE
MEPTEPKAPEPVQPSALIEPMERSAPAHTERGGLGPLVKVLVVFSMLGGAIALLWFSTSAEDAFVYSKLVHEVTKAPEQFRARELRVEGDLKPGSIKFQESPCEWRFVIKSEGEEMPVRFPQCVVPDTFKDGMGIKVTVQGKLAEGAGHFAATQVIPRCPSKYEMQQAQQRGEKMPHAPKPELHAPAGPRT